MCKTAYTTAVWDSTWKCCFHCEQILNVICQWIRPWVRPKCVTRLHLSSQVHDMLLCPTKQLITIYAQNWCFIFYQQCTMFNLPQCSTHCLLFTICTPMPPRIQLKAYRLDHQGLLGSTSVGLFLKASFSCLPWGSAGKLATRSYLSSFLPISSRFHTYSQVI